MRRFKESAYVVFAIALVASIVVHLETYGILGNVAERVFAEERAAAPAARPTEVEFVVTDPTEPLPETPPEMEPPPERPREKKPEPPKEAPKRERRAEKKPEPPTPPTPVEKKPEPPKPPVDPSNMQAVTQRSANPDTPPPDDPRFLARENNRVEEETVAEIRNYVRDDEAPTAGATERPTPPAPNEGNATEDKVADMREMEGSEARTATREEAAEDRPKQASEKPPPPPPERVAVARSGHADGDERSETPKPREASRRDPAPPNGTPTPEAPREIVVHDRFGTIRIPAPTGRQGERGQDTSEDARRESTGSERDRRAERARRGQPGGGSVGEMINPNRRYAWSDLQNLQNPNELEQERQAYIRERRSQRRGSGHQKQWREFRAAIENFVPNVRPGNQTALNAAASPFAEYLAEVHRRIHREFADRFLAGLPTWSGSPMANPDLRTKLEIILNRDGTIHRVGVVHSSGFLPFDYGAFASVMRGQPYPEPPGSILSGDGRVYFHWGFYRNERQCGTFNAEPYILPRPPGGPAPSRGPLSDQPEWGGVIPEGSRPTWGNGGGKESEGSSGSDAELRPASDHDHAH